jgi:hypothetical protein
MRDAQRTRLDLLALLLTPILVLIQGHHFGLSNQDFILSYIRRLRQPDWLATDWALSTPMHHPHLMQLLEPLTNMLGESAAFLFLQVATRLLLLMGVWRLVLALLPGRTAVAGLAMVAILVEPRLSLGGHYLHLRLWEPGHLGMAMAVWMLGTACRYLRGECSWRRLAVISGVGIYSHLFIGGPVFAVIVLTLLFRNWKNWETGAVVLGALLFSVASWLPAAQGFFFPQERGLSTGDLIRILQFRHPHHHQPWTWPILHYLQGGAILFSGAVAWRALRPQAGPTLAIPAILLAWFVVTCTAFALFGMTHRVPIIAYLQPFRLLSLLWLLHVIALFAYLEQAVNRYPTIGRISCLLIVFAMLRLVNVEGPLFASLLLLGLVRTRPYQVEQMSLIPFGSRYLFAGAAVAWAALIALQATPGLQQLVRNVRPTHWYTEAKPSEPERQHLTDWIQSNTTPTALFAIPPAMQNFRTWEQRPVVVDFKLVPFRSADLREWGERIALGMNVEPLKPFAVPPYNDAPAGQIILLGKTYGARYAVVRERLDTPATVYSTDHYSVLDLDLMEFQGG